MQSRALTIQNTPPPGRYRRMCIHKISSSFFFFFDLAGKAKWHVDGAVFTNSRPVSGRVRQERPSLARMLPQVNLYKSYFWIYSSARNCVKTPCLAHARAIPNSSRGADSQKPAPSTRHASMSDIPSPGRACPWHPASAPRTPPFPSGRRHPRYGGIITRLRTLTYEPHNLNQTT